MHRAYVKTAIQHLNLKNGFKKMYLILLCVKETPSLEINAASALII